MIELKQLLSNVMLCNQVPDDDRDHLVPGLGPGPQLARDHHHSPPLHPFELSGHGNNSGDKRYGHNMDNRGRQVGPMDDQRRVGHMDDHRRVGHMDDQRRAGHMDDQRRVGHMDDQRRAGHMDDQRRVGHMDDQRRVGHMDDRSRAVHLNDQRRFGNMNDRVGHMADRSGPMDDHHRDGHDRGSALMEDSGPFLKSPRGLNYSMTTENEPRVRT